MSGELLREKSPLCTAATAFRFSDDVVELTVTAGAPGVLLSGRGGRGSKISQFKETTSSSCSTACAVVTSGCSRATVGASLTSLASRFGDELAESPSPL